jgi:hypothetical protein
MVSVCSRFVGPKCTDREIEVRHRFRVPGLARAGQ